MSLFTAAEISEMHEAQNDALVDTCTVYRDDVEVETDVPCAVVKGTRSTMPGAGIARFDKRVDFTVIVKRDADILTNDVLIIVGSLVRLRAGELIQAASTYDHCKFVETIQEDA